jgi:hypothetical protein
MLNLCVLRASSAGLSTLCRCPRLDDRRSGFLLLSASGSSSSCIPVKRAACRGHDENGKTPARWRHGGHLGAVTSDNSFSICYSRFSIAQLAG